MTSSTFSTRRFDAVILDLDGVVTKTDQVHASTWKRLFDDYLRGLSERTGTPHPPFDLEQDYVRYVDGRPRYEGVRSFLASRELGMPLGDLSDPPDEPTICGLGNRKNLLFLDHIRSHGVEVYPSVMEFIHQLRNHRLGIGLMTSSKNCREVLDGAGLAQSFDVTVDGNDLLRLRLRGKPSPDALLETCRRLHVRPQRAVLVEDAAAGVKAGRAGGLGLVVGVARKENIDRLLGNGADVVIGDLSELRITPAPPSPVGDLPHALPLVESILARGRRGGLAVFLDYDGTLTPIVARPELAELPEAMRASVRRLAARCPVAIISGRDRVDVERLVGIDAVHCAGSHGLDAAGPGGGSREQEIAARAGIDLDRVESLLRDELFSVPGVAFERKRFGLAVHWREVPEQYRDRVNGAVGAAVERLPDLKIQTGRKVYDLVPKLDWSKGKAVRWLEEALGLDRERILSVYVGDDVTDEDAFCELADRGVGIVVRGGLGTTTAHFRLDDTNEVGQFIEGLARGLSEA